MGWNRLRTSKIRTHECAWYWNLGFKDWSVYVCELMNWESEKEEKMREIKIILKND